MAEDAVAVNGFARDWLEANRERLNGEFRVARRRWPRLDGDAMLALAGEVLPPLGARGGDGTAELLSETWSLLLNLAGRGLLGAAGGGSLPAISTLLREGFPALRGHLLRAPGRLPAALSNAVENLGERGEGFVRRLSQVGGLVGSPAELERAGAVVAWRLGEARLREAALRAAESLPGSAALKALGLEDWPAGAAPLAIAALRGDAWRLPEQAVSEESLEQAEGLSPKALARLCATVEASPAAPLASWVPAGPCGEFAGYGGDFEEPPLLLDPGAPQDRHRFFALTGAGAWRIDADVFGWTCRAEPEAATLKIREPRKRGLGSILLGGDDGLPTLSPDGMLRFGGEQLRLPALAGATSFAAASDVLAWTVEDSHRIRLLVPRGEPA